MKSVAAQCFIAFVNTLAIDEPPFSDIIMKLIPWIEDVSMSFNMFCRLLFALACLVVSASVIAATTNVIAYSLDSYAELFTACVYLIGIIFIVASIVKLYKKRGNIAILSFLLGAIFIFLPSIMMMKTACLCGSCDVPCPGSTPLTAAPATVDKPITAPTSNSKPAH